MRGELIAVWPETRAEIWIPLASSDSAPSEIFSELYRELVDSLKDAPKANELAAIVADKDQSKLWFQNTQSSDLKNERAIVSFFENAYDILEDIGADALANEYFLLLEGFVQKYSLRYDLRRPCMLCPTLPGVFTALVRDLRVATSRDAHLDQLMKDFEDSVRDLHAGCSENRIKTCIQKEINLLEALGRACPGITQETLGKICNELTVWPHIAVKESLKNLYHFSCDYPGIRHGGTPAKALRAIDMRDLVALGILLAGFTPYLTNHLDANVVYRGEL